MVLDTGSRDLYLTPEFFRMKTAATKVRMELEGPLPLGRCRQILGSDCQLSDEQVLLLRDQLLALATLLVDTFLEEASQGNTWSPGARAWIQPN